MSVIADGHTRPAFSHRSDDIFVASYPRSGTTWLQMIVYQLVADRQPFEHLSQVFPFLERALRSGRAFDECRPPRLFKTHLPFRHVAGRPGKYIYIVRDGRDVLVSYFHFHRAYLGATDSFDEFFEKFMAGNVLYGSWFRHVASWKTGADDANVLVVTYEQLLSSFDETISRIGSFLGCHVDPETRRRVHQQCSFAAMRRLESKFDPVLERALEAAPGSAPHTIPVASGSFLRQGVAGAWKSVLSSDQARAFEMVAAEFFSPALTTT